jgi:hypothetical protein
VTSAPTGPTSRAGSVSGAGSISGGGSVFDAQPRTLPARIGGLLEHHRPVTAAALTLLGGYLALSAVLVGLGALLVHVVLGSGVGRSDGSVSQWLADHRVAWLNHVTAGGTFIANTIPVIGVVLVVSAGFLLARR